MCVRECVYEKVSERPGENVICPDWTTGPEAYEHRPEEGQWLHCVAGQRVTVLGQETVAGPLAAASGPRG